MTHDVGLGLQLTKFLNAERRKHEVALALFGVYMAAGLSTDIASGQSPLGWAVRNPHAEVFIVAVLWCASVMHGVGIKWNGRGAYKSPALRLVGMFGFAAIFLTLAMLGMDNSAKYTYTAVAFVYAQGVRSAFVDLQITLKGVAYG